MVLVIGAGAAGLAAAAMLQRRGQSVVVLERAEIGAAWNGRYDRLHLHTVRRGLHFVGYRIVLGGNLRQAGIEARQLARAVASEEQ